MSEQRAFVLPVSIVSPTDIARLKREIDNVDSFFRQAQIREQPGQQEAMPRLSRLMDQLASDNQLNMLQEDHRAYIAQALEQLHSDAPVLHMSFSVDPPGSYVQKIVGWLRKNIHGQVLVTVGLQPNIGAGCIVRTTNKIFDFSLREYFKDKRSFFIDKMHEAINEVAVPEAPQEQAMESPVQPPQIEAAQQSQERAVAPAQVSEPVVAAEQPQAVSQTTSVTQDVPQPAPVPQPANTEAPEGAQ